ncbi:L-threonylcarbamoyladenylate synthase [Streptococcus hongkongensis]|nr:tRNA threonylcarbamoyl adenosine modification protein [Streptococcus uberis]
MKDLTEVIEAGQAVVLPTETVYGLFAKAMDEAAVDYVYHLKQRTRDKAMNLNVASYQDILTFSKDQPDYLKKLVETFLPGPLTIILKANDKVPTWINSGKRTIGFRMPKHSVTSQIIRETGPLIGPSANISGDESGKTFEAIIKAFNDQVSGYADDAALTGQDSTIIDLSGDTVKILRQGAITKEELLAKVPELEF